MVLMLDRAARPQRKDLRPRLPLVVRFQAPSGRGAGRYLTNHFGDLLVSLQFTFEVSPFFGHLCFWDCCSFAPREVSLSPEEDDLLGDMLESDWEFEDGGGVAVEELVGALCACAAAQAIRQILPNKAVIAARVMKLSLVCIGLSSFYTYRLA